MMIDEKGRLFGKLNLLDLILCVFLLAVIAFACVYFTGGSAQRGSTIPVVYTVEVRNREASYFEHIAEGDAISDGGTGVPMGTVIHFEKQPAQVLVQADDHLTTVSPEGRYDGYLQIEAEAKVRYPDLYVESTMLKIGRLVALRSDTLSIHGYIVGIDYDAEALRRVQ